MRARISSSLAVVGLLLAACAPATPSSAPSAAPTGSTAPATSAPTPVPTPAEAELKLMDFNIEYGGDEIDFDKIIEAIKLADPDVVALEEAEGNTQLVADALGWPYASTRTQVVSKLPIIDPPDANGRYVFIEIQPGAVVALSNVHLPSDPYGPYYVRDGKTVEEVVKLEQDTRMPAVQERLDVLPALVKAGIPAFLTGDFNAPSHRDWTEAAVGSRPNLLYPVPWPVSTAVEAAGFRDAYRELHPDPVKRPGPDVVGRSASRRRVPRPQGPAGPHRHHLLVRRVRDDGRRDRGRAGRTPGRPRRRPVGHRPSGRRRDVHRHAWGSADVRRRGAATCHGR